MVVPLRKAMHPSLACRLKTLERLILGYAGGILQSTEWVLGAGVVVADRRATKRGHDTQLLQGRQHSGSFHLSTIVCVQDQTILTGFTDQHACVIRRLIFMYFPADNLAAEDIQYQVESVEGTPDTGGQIDDVPTPYLI